MKSLMHGCAAAALLMGLAFQAHAEIAVQAAPVHTVPADEDDTPEAASQAAAAPAKAEPALIKALVQAKAPPQALTLTPEEDAFFVVLGQRVTDAASAYESYVRRAGGIDPGFSGAASVQRAVRASAAYHPQQLEAGIVAYAALVALRDQAFVDGVRAIQNPAFADDLAVHPESVLQVRGAQSAAIDVAGVLQAQGAALMASGKAITKAAYDIQAQAWSKSPVADPKAVLDGAKLSADQMRAATVPSKEKLLASLVTAPQGAGSGSGAAPDVVRGLALAAMAIMGKTGDGQEARYEALLHDASSADCLKMAKLNLNQCLASAGPHYEDIYCAGRHAVSDTGKCVAAAADSGAVEAGPPPRLQTAEVIGPEQAEAYGRAVSPGQDEDDDVAQPAPARRLASVAPAPGPIAAPPPPVVQAPMPAPAPRQYAELQAAPPQAELQRAEPMPDPRAPRGAAAPQAYAQNDYGRQAYAQQSYPQAQYPQPPQYQQPQYQQPQYQQAPYQPQQPYPQQYAQAQPQAQYAPQYQQQAYQQPQYEQPQYQQPQYQPQPYQQQPQAYAQSYGAQQPYNNPQGYPAYQGNAYTGR